MAMSMEGHFLLETTSHSRSVLGYQRTVRGNQCTVLGGYHYTFIGCDYERYMCIICQNVAKDIHQVTCCGKHLCKECLSKCRQHQGEHCPHCRATNLQNRIFPDTSANQAVQSLMIACLNRNNGCSWQGEVRDAEDHHSRCNFSLVRCECGQDVLKHEHKEHVLKQCALRLSECHLCSERGTYNWLATQHEAVCLEKLVDCPNEGCGEKMKRRELAEHQKICTKEKVSCQYHERLGCKDIMSRENLTAHEQEKLKKHLQMAEARIKQLEVHHKDEILYSKMQRVPITFKIESFQDQFDQKNVWESKGFYSDLHGYKMCLKVHLNGTGCGSGSHISYFLHLMPGIYDDNLPWPFSGKVVVQVLNQLENDKHSRNEKQFLAHQEMEYNKRVCGKLVSEIGLGEPRFFAHRDLVPKPENNINYVKDGSLYIQVHKIEVYSVPQAWLRPSCC